MKSTGIVRKVDELGRIVLPIELRRTLDIAEKDALEIYVDGSTIVLKKYRPSCIFCDSSRDLMVLWGDRIFEKCGIGRDERGDGGKTLEIRGKRRLPARDGGANYQQS